MHEPLDRNNLAECPRIGRMIGLGTITGLAWGACLGAGYGFALGLINISPALAVFATVIGAVLGLFYGFVLGSLHGLMLALITTSYFCPLGDERIYRGSLLVTGLVVNIGVGYFLVRYFHDPGQGWSEFMVFLGWPFLIATAASFKGNQSFAQWYIDERFRLAAQSVGNQTDEPVIS